MTRIVDLSHVIEDGMTTYPGLPGPELSDHLSREASRSRYAPGTEFHVGRINMVGNTGTYLDTPAHRFAGGSDLATTPLERMVELPAVVADAAGRGMIDADLFDGRDLRDKAILVRTDWSRHWGTKAYLEGHRHLTAAARGAILVGVDSLNVDGTVGGERPVHSTLLAAGILIVEHLCRLDELASSTDIRFCAAPPAIDGLDTFPVRAHAVLDDR